MEEVHGDSVRRPTTIERASPGARGVRKGPVLLGGGSLARDLIDCFGQDEFSAVFVDPQFASLVQIGLPVVSSWLAARSYASEYVLAVADVEQRRRFAAEADANGLRAAEPMVSRRAVVARDAIIDVGCTIGHFVVVGPNVRLSKNVLVMHHVVLGHDSHVQDGCVLCAGSSVAGRVVLGSGCFVGPNAALSPGVQIAAGSVLAPGAACLKSVPMRSTVVGSPARAFVRR